MWLWREKRHLRKVGGLACVKIGEAWVYLTGARKELGERERAETQGKADGCWWERLDTEPNEKTGFSAVIGTNLGNMVADIDGFSYDCSFLG